MSNVWTKAYNRLIELYGETADIRMINRFYSEKRILLSCELYMHYLEFFGRLREYATQKGEHIFVRGTAGSSFVAYLLGATDINPLPRHSYCPHCHKVIFMAEGSPFDSITGKCSCGEELVIDGHGVPFESNIKYAIAEKIQLGVSHSFFDEAKRMICDEMWDKAIITLHDRAIAPTRFCFLDREDNDDGDYALSGNSELFSDLPHITLVPVAMLDKYRELERKTGFKIKDIGYREQSLAFEGFMECSVAKIPHFDNSFMRNILKTVEPQSYGELLKLIGFSLSTNVWNDNAEILFDDRRMSLREIPAYREELYSMICDRLYQKGIYDGGFAYEIMERVRLGDYTRKGGIDDASLFALCHLGFDNDFICFLEKINYMFPKAHGVAYLREAIAMMFYKMQFGKEYDEIMLDNKA